MLSALREVQIPLLAVVLVGGCAAKTRYAISVRSIDAGVGVTALFPLRLRRPLGIVVSATELSLGVALLVTAWGPFGAGATAMMVRALTTLLFATAVAILHELRGRRPEAGCGCFGDLSHTPVSWRVLARSALLAMAALVTVTAGPLHALGPPTSEWMLGTAAAEVVVLAALSPEIGEVMVRLGYSEPCELRRIPVTRTLAALRGSAQWRRYRRYLTVTEPSDVWREGCWRYAVFPGIADGRMVDVVFAVYMQPRRPAVRAAIVEASTDQALASHTIPFQRSAPPPSADLYHSLKKSQY